jgi:hypothetical protein
MLNRSATPARAAPSAVIVKPLSSTLRNRTSLSSSSRLYVPAGASADAAAAEAAYRTLLAYFPSQQATLTPLYLSSMQAIPGNEAKMNGKVVGLEAADTVVALRSTDRRNTLLTSTSTFPTLPAGPGVYRRTAPAYLAPQTPWVGQVRPFSQQRDDQFLPPASAGALQQRVGRDAFSQIKALGGATSSMRTPEQTAVALFWTANVIRQCNGLARDVADARGLGLLQTARLLAMVNIVGGDAQIACINAKYHYLFWRPVAAIDPTSAIDDGFGPTPAANDGNAATTEQPGWRPLVATPNHRSTPPAHGSITSAEAEIFSTFLGTKQINLDIHGFDPAGPAGNLNTVGTSTPPTNSARNRQREAVAGLHYQFSGEAGVTLGREVADYDLAHAFLPRKKH